MDYPELARKRLKLVYPKAWADLERADFRVKTMPARDALDEGGR